MKTRTALALFVCAAFTAGAVLAADAPPVAAEKKKLAGTWVGGVKNPGGKGKSGSATMVQISEITFDQNGKITACKDGKGVSLGTCQTVSLDLAAKQMDATGSTRNHNGVFQGIYRFNGENLEWCAANPGKPRPDGYYTVPQVQFHMVFSKKK
jgi:uncharacterized protein (TIGR03067 family)